MVLVFLSSFKKTEVIFNIFWMQKNMFKHIFVFSTTKIVAEAAKHPKV